MTPAIPLLVGWFCIAGLFAALPARQWGEQGVALALFITLASLAGLVLDRSWQMLMLGLMMAGAAASIGAALVQGNAPQRTQTPQSGAQLLAWAWLLAGLLNAAIGLLQYFQKTAWLGELVNHAPPGQVYGNLRQRNQFASLMLIALWSAWYLWQFGGLQKMAAWLRLPNASSGARLPGSAVLAWLLMLPLAAGAALTVSRTGFVQLLTLMGMVLFWAWRFRRHALAAQLAWLGSMALVYVLASFVLPHLTGATDLLARLEGADSRACMSRKVLWSNMLYLIAQKPWTGWGWGNLEFAHYYANYPGMRFCQLLDNAHNLPLHLAVELGVPLAVGFCGLALWWIWRNQPWREQAPHRQLMWGVLGVIAIHSLLEYPLWYAPFQMACGLALGVLWATQPQLGGAQDMAGAAASGDAGEAGAQNQTVSPRAMLPAQRMVAVLMLAGLAYAGFDYVRVSQLYVVPQDRVWPFKTHTLEQAERTPLYRNAVDFAKLSMTQAAPENAQEQLLLARRLMHYSAEARVVQRMIESLRLLGREAEAQTEEAHFREVYPQEYARWKEQAGQTQPATDGGSGAQE